MWLRVLREKRFQTQITWFTVSLSLTLVFLRSEVALSTCERAQKVNSDYTTEKIQRKGNEIDGVVYL